MSELDNGENGNRATVALVNSKIDTVLAKVEGNAQVTEAHFETIKTRLDAVGSLAGRMDTLEQKHTVLEASVSQLQRARVYRSTTLPPILIGVASLAVAIAAIILAGVH